MEEKQRYEVWPIELERSPYRWEVVDLERSAKIIGRFASKEGAENVAKQMNEKGYVETF